jgi:hypothetical protein
MVQQWSTGGARDSTVDLAVRVAGRPYNVRTGRLVDLSVSGAFINVAADLRLLSRVQIAITPCPSASPIRRP